MMDKKFACLVGFDAWAGIPLEIGVDITLHGASDLNRFWAEQPELFTMVQITKNYFRQPRRYNVHQYSLLVNLVTDADQNPKSLANIARMVRGYKGAIINHPDAVMRTTREQVAARLAGLPNVIVPKTIRLRTDKPNIVLGDIAKAGMRFPVIVREVGAHGGRVVGLFDRAEDIPPKLLPKREHFVTEFVDFVSPDGLYRKYRVFAFGKRLILRHMLIDNRWNIHAKSRSRFMADRPRVLDEERALFDAGLPGRVTSRIELMRHRMGLDFFGVDFGLTPDLDLVLFEANATMNFFPFFDDPKFDYVKNCKPRAAAAVQEMLNAKLRVDA